MDIDLSEKSAGEGEDIIERFISEGTGHLSVLGKGAHGLCQVHLHDEVIQDLYPNHTVLHRTLQSHTECQSDTVIGA